MEEKSYSLDQQDNYTVATLTGNSGELLGCTIRRKNPTPVALALERESMERLTAFLTSAYGTGSFLTQLRTFYADHTHSDTPFSELFDSLKLTYHRLK